jgi:ABC-type Fe2+-enterobactin transport system substrate-binding protein
MARGALIPVAEARLVNLFQPLQPPAIERGALKGGIQQRRAAQRQFCHVVAEFERIIEQQQRALNVFVRQQLAQVAAIARLAQLQAEILRALGQAVGAFCSCWVSLSSVR